MTGFELAKLVGQIPRNVLPRADRAVLQAMAHRYPNIWPSAATLGDEAHYSPKIVSGAWTRLLERGLIDIAPGHNRKGGRGKTTRYVVNPDAVAALVPKKNSVRTTEQEERNPVKQDRNPVNLTSNPGKATGFPTETLSKGQTNKPATPNKTNNKNSNKGISKRRAAIVAKTVEQLLLLFLEEEKTKPPSTREQRENLAPIIVAYGPRLVTPTWKKYLKERDTFTTRSWPLVDFTENFAVWLKMAEKDRKYADEIQMVRRKLYLAVWTGPGWYHGFKETLTSEEIEILESYAAWRKAHKNDDFDKAIEQIPLNKAGVLLDLYERDAEWCQENKKLIDAHDKEETEWYEQHKDDPETPGTSDEE